MHWAQLSTFLALGTEVEMSETEMPRSSSSGLSWIGLHGKRHVYETGVKGHFKKCKVVAETQCFLGCSWKSQHLIPLAA